MVKIAIIAVVIILSFNFYCNTTHYLIIFIMNLADFILNYFLLVNFLFLFQFPFISLLLIIFLIFYIKKIKLYFMKYIIDDV